MDKGSLFCLAAGLVWGFGLVGQSAGMDTMGPLSFSAVRLTLGAVSMLVLSLVLDALRKKREPAYRAGVEYKKAWKPALVCAPFILATILLQQYGLQHTEVGKCAFITAFYIFLIPLFGLFLGKKLTGRMGLAVVLAVGGLYLITMSKGFGQINFGDVLSFLAAVCYTMYFHILDRYAPELDSLKFSMFQFLACGLVCFPAAAIFETGDICWANYVGGIVPILFTGIVSCAGGYTLQIAGLARTEPNKASLLMSAETVFSLFAGLMILGERLTVKEYIGCAVMTAAIVLSVLPEKDS